jgi:hypothetical protein
MVSDLFNRYVFETSSSGGEMVVRATNTTPRHDHHNFSPGSNNCNEQFN